eukprot:m.925518 g.925518  ORF g.925518 m.925518 type:complete len:419 (-) comp132159_c0_seq1:150-1406(-)
MSCKARWRPARAQASMLSAGPGLPSSRVHANCTPSSPATRSQCTAQSSACGCKPWCTWRATTRCSVAARATAWSSAVESRPPLKATATASQDRSAVLGVAESAIGLQALVATVQQFAGLQVADLAQRIRQRTLEVGCHLLGVAVGAAHRLADDLVDEPQRLQAVGRDAQRVGRVGRALTALPQDGCTAFGRDDRVGRELQHQHLVGHADGQRTARAALTNDGGDDGHLELRHLEDVAADGLALAAFFGTDARVGAHGVDESEDGQPELLGHLHQAQCLAIALGAGHAEVAQRALLGVAAALVADDHAGLAVEARNAANDGRVIREMAVAVQFLELGEDFRAVVQRLRPLRVAGDLIDLPRRHARVDLFGQLLAFLGEAVDLFRDVDGRLALHIAQFFDLGFEFSDRLLEFEEVFFAHQ